MSSDTSTLGQAFAGISNDVLYPVLVGFIIGGLLAAFFSFRFFKITIIFLGAVIGYSFGEATLGMLIGDRITAFNAAFVLGIACAVVFGILAPKFYKLCIYVIGGIIGFSFGMSLTVGLLSGFGYYTAGYLAGIFAGAALAVLGAKLFYRCFKPYIIVSSSFIGSLIAAIFTSFMLFGDNEIAIALFTVLGIILGVISTRAQFKMNRGRELDL